MAACTYIIVTLFLFYSVKVRGASLQIFNISCTPNSQEISQHGCESETLESIAMKVEEHSNVQINIKIPHLYLHTKVNFTNLNRLSIFGRQHQTIVTCNSSNSSLGAGIVFSNINDLLTLENVTFHYCGSSFRYEFRDNTTFISALTLVGCTNVHIKGLIVQKSEGMGLMIVNHVGGNVNVTSSVFRENRLLQKYAMKFLQGGGGVFIYLGHFLPGVSHSPMTFRFKNCSFVNNTGHTKYYKFHYTNILGETLKGYGMGGGASLTMKKGTKNVYVEFSDCEFALNEAFFGAGLSVRAYRSVTDLRIANITVEIKNSVFQENGCSNISHTYYGGGAYLAFTTSVHQSAIMNSSYIVKDTFFTRNCAELGGAVLYFSDQKYGLHTHVNSSVVFDGCTFEYNKANIGSAIMLSPNILEKLSPGYSVIVPVIKDCEFKGNSITIHRVKLTHITQSIESDGVGTIYACQYSFTLEGFNRFESNWGTPIYIVEGVVNLVHSDVRFFNNTGLNGGAIALIGSSRVIVGPHRYEFTDNTAIDNGGALYSLLMDITDFTISRTCFIQYRDNESIFLTDNWKSTIVFKGNKAKDSKSGHAIYATSLHSCQVINKGNKIKDNFTMVNASEVFKERHITFDDNPSLQPQIVTDGSLLNSSKGPLLKIIPGKKTSHGVIVTDDLGQNVESLFHATVSRSSNNVSMQSSYVKEQICLSGEPNQNTSLFIKTTSPRKSYITFNITLIECPPGFILNHNKECVCNVESYVGLLQCDMDNFHSHLYFGYWVGKFESPEGYHSLATSACPYCDYGDNVVQNSSVLIVKLPQSYSNLSKTVCGETRKGIVCGICREGYTVHFHSPGYLCKPAEPLGCKLGWLFYILSELLPVTVVFITVLALNISFTSGVVNGFILFSQLITNFDIDASGRIAYPESMQQKMHKWTQAYNVLYGFFNLETFHIEHLSFCLWKNATALDMIAVKYITILYSLILILILVFTMKHCGGKCCGRYCRITTIKTSVVHGLSTFIVMCYMQCVTVSLNLLYSVSFYVEVNSKFTPISRVLFNGELVYFSKEHLVYAIPAIFCLSTVGLFPIAILLAYPLLNKTMALLGCDQLKIIEFMSRKLKIISSLKPLLDSIQGCYKDNFRFFAGLYFLSKFVFIFYVTKGFLGYYTGVGVCLLILLTLHSMCQPYLKRSHNVIDSLLLANLLLINLLSLFNLSKSYYHRDLHEVIFPAALQRALILLPIVVVSVYVAVMLCRKRIYKSNFLTSCISGSRGKKLKKLAQLIANDIDSDEDASFIDQRFASGSEVCYHLSDESAM